MLAATASRSASVEGISGHGDIADMRGGERGQLYGPTRDQEDGRAFVERGEGTGTASGSSSRRNTMIG